MRQVVLSEAEFDMVLQALSIGASQSTGTEMIVLGNSLEQRAGACAELRRAVRFFDQVKNSSEDEKVAVGADHWNRLEAAAREVASFEGVIDGGQFLSPLRPSPPIEGSKDSGAEAFRVLLTSAYHALRSYEFHNGSPDLAKSVADEIQKAIPSLSAGERAEALNG